jgi:putative DNA primase/helicase
MAETCIFARREDDTAEVMRRIKDTQGALYRWVAARIKELGDEIGDEENAERAAKLKSLRALLKHCEKWEGTRELEDCAKSMRSERGVPIRPAQLDTDPFLLNVLNGTIDLRTGRLRDHRREDLITKIAPVEFHPDTQCPLWQSCLDRWMDGNMDLIGYLQRVFGYWMTGDVSEHALWIFHGCGANGKTTALLTLLDLLGDYAIQAVSDLLLQKKSESHPTERADLFGCRLAASIETDEGRRLSEALAKQLSGGDKIRARKLYKDFFQFDATHKIVLGVNHKPRVTGTDHGIWRRIKLVPWSVVIPEEEKDRHMAEKLKGEMPGILIVPGGEQARLG